MIKDFIFGKLKKYQIQSDGNIFTVAGRSYCMNKKGFLIIRDGFTKVGTFVNAKYITEI